MYKALSLAISQPSHAAHRVLALQIFLVSQWLSLLASPIWLSLQTFLQRFLNQWQSLPTAPRVSAEPADLPTKIHEPMTKSSSKSKKVTIWRSLYMRFFLMKKNLLHNFVLIGWFLLTGI